MEKHYSFAHFEKIVMQEWEHINPPSRRVGQKTYTIIMPPPNVTGSLHLGHAFSSTLQDILVRMHRMKGFYVLWLPGTDHAGIATQMMVEKDLLNKGITKAALGREKFLEHVWTWKEKYGHMIIEQIKRMGFSPNWDKLSFTLDPKINKAVIHAFVTLYNKKFIYRAERLINWDPILETALSDLEVVNRMEEGVLWTIRYPLTCGKGYVDVATTRPETIFGDVAVAVHPDDTRYSGLIGQQVVVPLSGGRTIPIVADAAVQQDKGSGAVKITPAHDFLDFEIAQRHSLPMINIMDVHSCLEKNVHPDVVGLPPLKARPLVLGLLEKESVLVQRDAIEHAIPYSERSGARVEPRLMPQWFMDTKNVAKQAYDAVSHHQTIFFPALWKDNYHEWLANIQPWCLSRQLWWGHQLPVWYGPEDTVFVAHDAQEAHQKAQQHFGHVVTLTQDEDVLDTWFSSGLWPFSTLGWPDHLENDYYPTDVLITGFDIIFFWVARMMMLGIELTDTVPFRHVCIHPLIRDEKGHKMSKTKHNVINPLEVVESHGADALRYGFLLAASGKQHMNFSMKSVDQAQHFMTKIWNLARFLHQKPFFSAWKHERDSFDATGVHNPINRWIVHHFMNAIKETEERLGRYEFHEAALQLYHTIWHIFCDQYLELAKCNMDTDQEIQHTFLWVFEVIIKLLHPFLPFMTDVLWHHLTGNYGLSYTSWPTYVPVECVEKDTIIWMFDVLHKLRQMRATFGVSGTDITFHNIHPHQQDFISGYHYFFHKHAKIGRMLFSGLAPSNPHCIIIPLSQGAITLEIDPLWAEKYHMQLEKEKRSLTDEIINLEEKLADRDWCQKAPAHIIESVKNRLLECEKRMHYIDQSLPSRAG